jgi:carboxyl-terminal processing protease
MKEQVRNSRMKRRYEGLTIVGLLMGIVFSGPVCRAQQQPTLSKDEQFRLSGMLRDGYNDVKKYYYDPKLKGVDWEARYQQYTAMIGSAHNLGEGFRVIAAFLSGLQDSHTFFTPPERATRYDSGYRYALVGDASFITQVRPGTDAASKLHVGDQVVLLDGFNVNREDFHDLRYFFNILAPQAMVQIDLRSPAGEQRRVVVKSVVKPNKLVMDLGNAADYAELVRREENEDHATRSQVIENGAAAIWKLQQFDLDSGEIDKDISIARRHKTLILDLRGNSGGYTDTLKSMVGSFFEHDIKIGDRAGKKESKPMIAKHNGNPFTGKLIVLVDSGSASASELLARVVQLEHRGSVIGDRTAGAVMEARYYSEKQGLDTKIFYGFSVTDANLIMSDGKSLEKTGVVPDEVLLPTGADLAAGRDPVLAYAAELAGVKLDPAAAGKLFPFEWQPL